MKKFIIAAAFLVILFVLFSSGRDIKKFENTAENNNKFVNKISVPSKFLNSEETSSLQKEAKENGRIINSKETLSKLKLKIEQRMNGAKLLLDEKISPSFISSKKKLLINNGVNKNVLVLGVRALSSENRSIEGDEKVIEFGPYYIISSDGSSLLEASYLMQNATESNDFSIWTGRLIFSGTDQQKASKIFSQLGTEVENSFSQIEIIFSKPIIASDKELEEIIKIFKDLSSQYKLKFEIREIFSETP